MNVYAVSSGYYDAYAIACICPDKETAERLARDLSDDDYDDYYVEEFPYVEEPDVTATYQMRATLYDDGTVRYGGQSEYRNITATMSAEETQPVKWTWNRCISTTQRAGGVLNVTGTDPERVRHVYGATKTQLLASPAFRALPQAGGHA